MGKKFIKVLSLLLFVNLFALTLLEDIDFKPGDLYVIKEEFPAKQIKNAYTLKIENAQDIQNYIKVTLFPAKDEQTPILCYSPTDPNCENNRLIMIDRPDKKEAIAFIKKEEILEDSKNPNILITCKEENCNYTIRFDEVETCQIDGNEGFTYSYVVSKDNQEMDFEVISVTNEETVIFIGLEGSENSTINIEKEGIQSLSSEKAKLISYEIGIDSKGKKISISQFSIKDANEGDYISLSVYTVFRSHAPDNLLFPGGSFILGAVFFNYVYLSKLCFPISAFTYDYISDNNFYASIKVYSRFGLLYMEDEKGEFIDNTDVEISDGLLSYLIESKGEKRNLCVDFSIFIDSQKDFIFSLALLPIKKENKLIYNYWNTPMLTGDAHRRMLKKNTTGIYHFTKVDKIFERFNIHIFNIKGFTEIYILDCNNFPNCENINDTQKMTFVQSIGNVAVYEREINKTMEPFDLNKKVIVVKCLNIGNDSEEYCEFDLSLFTKGQTINLREDEYFAKFVQKDEEGTFRVNFYDSLIPTLIKVEIMVYSGEVIFEGKRADGSSFDGYDYIMANKILFDFNNKYEEYYSMLVNYKAMRNSFFTIKYFYYSKKGLKIAKEEPIFPGENYLVSLSNEISSSPNTFRLINYNSNYSINCEFNISRLNKDKTVSNEIPFLPDFIQDIRELNEENNFDYCDYDIKVTKEEDSNYDRLMCKLYLTVYQTSELNISSYIFIPNNIEQKLVFNPHLSKVRYIYPISDVNMDSIIYFNVFHRAEYFLEVYIENEDNLISKNITSETTYIYLNKELYKEKCNENSFCYLIIIVGVNNEFLFSQSEYENYKNTPMIELTVRETSNEEIEYHIPTYFATNKKKMDFKIGDGYYYLYTEIGQRDFGSITFDILGNLDVYGRIVTKDSKDNETQWKNMYRLPSSKYLNDSINYNKYSQNYLFKMEDTLNCNIECCYLIIGMKINHNQQIKFAQFNIIPQIYKYYKSQPLILIHTEEFIIDNVDISKNETILQLYQVYLPKDSNQIDFELHSELVGLYVNIGDNIPNSKSANFIFIPKERESIFTIDKKEIIENFGDKLRYNNSLEGLELILGIWTDKSDNANRELFSLKIHLPDINEYNLDIIEMKKNQKSLCKPVKIGEEKYQCLLMVSYNEEDINQEKDLLVFIKTVNENSSTKIY